MNVFEQVNHLRTDLQAANLKIREQAEELERLRPHAKELRALLVDFIDEYGVEHDDPGCPEDDCCLCPNVARINLALKDGE